MQFENNLVQRFYCLWTRFNKTLNSWALSITIKVWFELFGINIKQKTDPKFLKIFENNKERFLVTKMCYTLLFSSKRFVNLSKDTKIPSLLSSIFSHEDCSLFFDIYCYCREQMFCVQEQILNINCLFFERHKSCHTISCYTPAKFKHALWSDSDWLLKWSGITISPVAKLVFVLMIHDTLKW